MRNHTDGLRRNWDAMSVTDLLEVFAPAFPQPTKIKRLLSITVYLAPSDYSPVLPSTTCFSWQNRPAWTVCGGSPETRSQRALDPSLPPWSPLTQMERPNCSGCLTIKAPMVELNYTNSKQFFFYLGWTQNDAAGMFVHPPGRPFDSLLRLNRRCCLSSEGTLAHSELDDCSGKTGSRWCTGLKRICAMLWKIKGERDAEHVDQSAADPSLQSPRSLQMKSERSDGSRCGWCHGFLSSVGK